MLVARSLRTQLSDLVNGPFVKDTFEIVTSCISVKMKFFRSDSYKRVFSCLLLILATLISFGAPSTEANSKKTLRYLSERHFAFAIELYREVAKSRSVNLVISAHNVNMGLALLFLGTTANTTSSYELRKTLHYQNVSYVNIHKSNK